MQPERGLCFEGLVFARFWGGEAAPKQSGEKEGKNLSTKPRHRQPVDYQTTS